MTSNSDAVARSLRGLLAASAPPGGEGAGGLIAERMDAVLSASPTVLGVDTVGLMMVDDRNRLRLVGSTDVLASRLEQAQIELGGGPGIDAQRSEQPVIVEDLAAAVEYAELWSRVAALGVRAVLATPVRVERSVVGNLNGFGRQPHPWSALEISAHTAYARILGMVLRAAVRAHRAENDAAQLRVRLALTPSLPRAPEAGVDADGVDGP